MIGILRSCTAIVLCFCLVGCASNQLVGTGLVERSIIIKKQDATTGMNLSASSGAKSGAKDGAITGAALGLATGPFAIIVSPILAVVGGANGAIIGGAGGALYGYSKSKHQFLFTYAVHNFKNGKMYLVHQYDSVAIPNKTFVNIYLGDHNIYHIIPLSAKDLKHFYLTHTHAEISAALNASDVNKTHGQKKVSQPAKKTSVESNQSQ